MDPTVVDLKKSVVKFVDGSGTPKVLTLKLDEGNLTYSVKKNREYRKDRGNLDTVRDGDDEPMEVTLQCRFHSIKSDTGETVTPFEFLTKTGAASAYVTTAADTCAPYAIDIVVEITNDCGSVKDEVLTFSEFRYEDIGGDFGAGQLSISGKCNAVMPTSVRTTLS